MSRSIRSIIALLLSVLILFSLFGCVKGENGDETTSADTTHIDADGTTESLKKDTTNSYVDSTTYETAYYEESIMPPEGWLTDLETPPDGNTMYSVSFEFKTATSEPISSNEEEISPVCINFNVPYYYYCEEEASAFDCTQYYRYKAEERYADLALEIRRCPYSVDRDFVLDENFYKHIDKYGFLSYLENYEVSVGKNMSGYDYVVYETEIPEYDTYRAFVYIRITENYVIWFEYSDAMRNYEYMAKSIDSIKVVEY